MEAIHIALPELGPRPRVQPVRRSIIEQGLSLAARDGHPLAATLFRPSQPNGVSVLIAPAYAVPRTYYASYARYLAQRGFLVLSFDYRGVGGSRTGHEQTATVRDWAEQDLRAMVDWLHEQAPHYRLALVGHSMGGQLLGLLPDNARIAAMLAIGSQSGWWTLRDGIHRPLAWLYFAAIIPLMAWLSSWFPALARGPFAVPRGVALQFARWGRGPVYIADEHGQPLREHFEAFRGRIRLYHIEDDRDYGPYRAVHALASFYRNAQTEVITRSPYDWGMAAVGHFGFFRNSMARGAWDETAQWLLEAAQPERRTIRAYSAPIHEIAA